MVSGIKGTLTITTSRNVGLHAKQGKINQVHKQANYAFLYAIQHRELPQKKLDARQLNAQFVDISDLIGNNNRLGSVKLQVHCNNLGRSNNPAQTLLDIAQQSDILGISHSKDVPHIARALAYVRVLDYQPEAAKEEVLGFLNNIARLSKEDKRLLVQFVEQYSSNLAVNKQSKFTTK